VDYTSAFKVGKASAKAARFVAPPTVTVSVSVTVVVTVVVWSIVS